MFNLISALAVAFSALLIFLLIWWRLKKRGNDQSQRWLFSFLSVVLSTLFALSTGLALFQWQEYTEQRDRTEAYRQLLSNEIGYILLSIDERPESKVIANDDTLMYRLMYLPNDILLEAGKSGLFLREQSFVMLSTASLINEYNMLTDYLFTAIASGRVPELNLAIDQLGEVRGNVHRGSAYILDQLKLGVMNSALRSFGVTPDTIPEPAPSESPHGQ